MWMNFPQLFVGDGAEGYVLLNRLDLAGAGGGATIVPAWAARPVIERWIHDPESFELRCLGARLLGMDRPGYLDVAARLALAERLCDCLSDEAGCLALVRVAEPASLPRLLRRPQLDIDEAMWASATHPYAGETVLPAAVPPSAPQEKKQNVIDWYIECKHHSTGKPARRLFEKGSAIQVLPDKGKLSDLVKVAYRNDLDPPPPKLRLSGARDGEVAKSGAIGPYSLYDFDAKYLGNVSQEAFFLPSFWKAYFDKTSYSLAGAPNTVNVEVYNPRRYKFEFTCPPAKFFKAGARLEKDITNQGIKPVVTGDYKLMWKSEEVNWNKSTHVVDRTKYKYTEKDGLKGPTDHEVKTAIQKIAFYIDDAKVELDIIKLLLTLFYLQDMVREVISNIQENAPKVGWYLECNFQLLQGGLIVSWNWQEHKDHRVFQYIDVNIQMQLIKANLDLGVGISGLGFRAQIYVQIAGEATVGLDGRHDDPDQLLSVAVPFKALIKGAIGARFEVGNICRADGKGETGIQFDIEIGINRGRSSMVSFDIGLKWTGLRVEATVSAGLFGIGGQKKWERTLVTERSLGKKRFPDDQPYQPPVLSLSRIKASLLTVITQGWNIRVIREVEGFFNSDVHWTPDQIAQAIADKVAAHPTFYRTPRNVEGLAHAVRKALDEKGRQAWARDFVPEAKFLEFVNGPELKSILDAAPSAVAEFRQAAGH